MSTYDDDPTGETPTEPTDVLGEPVAPPPPPPESPAPRPDGGRHPVNIGHLVMGLVFLTFVALWGLVQTDVVGGHDLRFLLPVPWVVGGAVGLVVALVVGGRRRRS